MPNTKLKKPANGKTPGNGTRKSSADPAGALSFKGLIV